MSRLSIVWGRLGDQEFAIDNFTLDGPLAAGETKKLPTHK